MGKAFDRIKGGLDEIDEWKRGAAKATIHFGGKSYEMTRPEHDAFRLGVAAGRLGGLGEAAALAAELDPNAVDVSAAILALAKP